MIIIGIDPGTERTGYGVLEKRQPNSPTFETLEYGCIFTQRTQTKAQRLLSLEKQLLALFRKYPPAAVGIETLFFFKNVKTVMPVSEARGVILLATAKHKLPIYEFSPLQVKMAIAGYGRAEKKQVQRMVQETLGLTELPKPDDAADGLALALACSFALKNGISPS